MNTIKNNLNEMLKNAMLNHDSSRLEVIRSIKTTFTNWEKANPGVELTDADEVKLLLKMYAQREDSIVQYFKAGRQDLVDKESAELAILKEYIPKQPTDEDIAELTKKVIAEFENTNNRKVEMRDMKSILTEVQKTYPSASGKIVSMIVKG